MCLVRTRGENLVLNAIVFRLATVVMLLLISCFTIGLGAAGKGKGSHLVSERNTELSDLLSRLELLESAGTGHLTGQYFVKLYEVSRGEECDSESDLCEGTDLLISVRSPDLFGDRALYRVKGLSKWRFKGWTQYAQVDGPEHYTSFTVFLQTRDGRPIPECGKAKPDGENSVTIQVNPWKIRCNYGE